MQQESATLNTSRGTGRALATTNLALWNRPDPNKQQIERDDYYAHEPEDAIIVRAVVAEYNSKDDAAKVACGANEARHDT